MKARPFSKPRAISTVPGTRAAAPAAPEAAPAPVEAKPMTQRFVPRHRRPPALSAEQAARQGRAVALALGAFAAPAEAMAFLNTDQAGLGRPLDWAIESGAGLDAVAQALARRAAMA